MSPVGEEGQASVELARRRPPRSCVVALLALQLLAAGYALTLADHAAEAGALALANGGPRGAGRPRRASRLGARPSRRRPWTAGGSRCGCARRRRWRRSREASR